jgi:sialate O-acetylesterase
VAADKERRLKYCVTILSFVLGTCALADVKLPAVISDGMILQAGMAAPIFGTAGPNEKVTVSFNGQTKTATAGTDGKWSVKLDAMTAGGPFELKVNTLTIKDVLVGEVWIASGQSNMHFPLDKSTGGSEAIAKSANPKIRFYTTGGKWTEFSPKSTGRFAAVAFYFAVDLFEHVKVPVGIIENAVPGAIIQTYMSAEAIDADPAVATIAKKHSQDAGQAISEHWTPQIVPLIPYGIKGVIWYQGEGNRDFPVTYRKLFATMIGEWRKQWGQGDFPFIYVQLANFGAKSPNIVEGKDCALREAQLKTLSVPNTAMAVTIDLGIEKDVHYPDKKPVGERLSAAARAIAYGEKIEFSGPLFKEVKIDGAKASISFTHVGGGLVAKGGALKGFAICGADRKWVRADAGIAGDTVVVSSAQVAAPVFVRYAWEKNPDCNLYNKDNFPASPFRTDEIVNFVTKDGE